MGNFNMDILRGEMRRYYRKLWPEKVYAANLRDPDWELPGDDEERFKISFAIQKKMDALLENNPDIEPIQLKAKLHETIAGNFEPEIFPHSPFFFEMGVRPAPNWGTPGAGEHAGGWMFRKFHYLFDHNPKTAKLFECRINGRIENRYGYVDSDHFYFPYTRVLKNGLSGILREAEEALEKCENDDELSFVNASIRSIKTVKEISRKFAEKSRKMLNNTCDEQEKKFLALIADTAGRVPWNSPQTFYEGLAAMLFLREVTGSLEGIGMSIMGHPDRLLNDLYQRDLAAGRITRKEALDLVSRWMLPTDVKFEVDFHKWPETSSTLMLGGCDAGGKTVFNDVTEIFLEAHLKHKLINPKLNCRFNQETPDKFLEIISGQILAGHNNFAILNDECLIDANVKAGKTVEDCRLYGAGGCQETVIEGVEHSAGAYYYFNLPSTFRHYLYDNDFTREFVQESGIPKQTENINSFEDYYKTVMGFMGKVITQGGEIRRKCGKAWPKVNPCPLFSAALEGCLKNRKDFTAGGGKYNPGGIALVGFGTLVDSLFAIKKLCFDEYTVSYGELRQALTANWEGCDPVRRAVLEVPKYGHNSGEVDQLAKRVAADLAEISRSMTNERGGKFQPSFFVYYNYVNMARETPATPDGRVYGEMYSQGISPGRLVPADSLTDAVMSLANIDFTGYPGNAVLDVQLPAGELDAEKLVSVIRVFGLMKAPTLQINCVNVNTLKDAQKHPEKHRDLTVRISGLSAKFVKLEKSVQDEIISRNLLANV